MRYCRRGWIREYRSPGSAATSNSPVTTAHGQYISSFFVLLVSEYLRTRTRCAHKSVRTNVYRGPYTGRAPCPMSWTAAQRVGRSLIAGLHRVGW